MYRLPQFDIGWQKYADLFRLERNDKDRDAFDNIAVLQTMQHRGALRATMISYFP